jgi:CheY-like chemotaxis protein
MIRAHLPNARILIVDDIATNLDVAAGLMKPYGMTIDCVDSGIAAIDRIQNGPEKYDAIFMDHMMPEMDGVEATRIIREEIGTEYAKNIPIIALTANALPGDEEIYLNSGFQAYVPKPIDIMRLDAVINAWIRDRQAAAPEIAAGAPAESAIDWTPIAGLDIHGGIAKFGGDAQVFLDILESYATHTPGLTDQLTAFAADRLPDYAIVVHGIKSSSRNIGAEDIGTKAEMLEHAAKANDAAYVQENNDALIAAIRRLILSIEATLAQAASRQDKPKKPAPDAESLRQLLAACRTFDVERAEEIVRDLEHYRYEAQGDLVVWLREQIDVSGFKKITERLSSMIQLV